MVKLYVKMKYRVRYIAMAVAMLSAFTASAQNAVNERFAIKATADIGIGNALSTGFALSGMDTKSSSSDFGVDFGWTFWKHNHNSLEVNIGLGYGRTSLTADLSKLDYHYAAPAEADMDNEPYIRYYELKGMHQKIVSDRMTLPVYLNYRYEISRIFSVHALAGFKFGFNVSSKLDDVKGNVFSYGIYPQYDNLMIDASYMNSFGEAVLDSDQAVKPATNGVTASLMAGVGAEIRIWGPLAADVTLRYEGAMNDTFKSEYSKTGSFDAENAPVSYTVADGQKVQALSGYLSKSKMSRLSCGISLICRF